MQTNSEPIAADIAGHCAEITAWRLLMDMAREVIEAGEAYAIRPSLIAIQDDGGFTLLRRQAVDGDSFDAPEVGRQGQQTPAGSVWSLGATAFYVMMGCLPFAGKGSHRQTKASAIPYLRASMPELSELIQRSLRFQPQQRPQMQEVLSTAQQHYKRCEESVRRGPALCKPQGSGPQGKTSEGFWPEAMTAEQSNL